MTRPIRIEIAPGELIDRITILEIKAERIADAGQRANVLIELATLTDARAAAISPDGEIDRLAAELKAVNEALWEIEDDIRECDRDGDFARFCGDDGAVHSVHLVEEAQRYGRVLGHWCRVCDICNGSSDLSGISG